MLKVVIIALALIAIAFSSEVDVIHHYSKHGYGNGVSNRYFRKAQGHGYGLGHGYGGHEGYRRGYGGYGLGYDGSDFGFERGLGYNNHGYEGYGFDGYRGLGYYD